MYHMHQSFGYSIVDACDLWYSLYVFPFRQCAGFIGRRTRLHLNKKNRHRGTWSHRRYPRYGAKRSLIDEESCLIRILTLYKHIRQFSSRVSSFLAPQWLCLILPEFSRRESRNAFRIRINGCQTKLRGWKKPNDASLCPATFSKRRW